MLVKLTPMSDSSGTKIQTCGTSNDPTKLFFLFFFLGVKLGHFNINIFFLYVMKMQAYQRKTEKFFVIKEKKFGRIDSSLTHQSSIFKSKKSHYTKQDCGLKS